MRKRRPTPRFKRLREERGAAAVLLAVMLVALLSVLAVTIDGTRLMTLRAELQTAVDAAALAGAIELALGGGDNAENVAIAYAAQNDAEGIPVAIGPDDVTFGVWDDVARTFTPLPSSIGANALEVTASREVNNWVAWIINHLTGTPGARATAWAEAPVGATDDCVKPWAIPEELLDVNGDGDIEQWEVDQKIQNNEEFILKSATGTTADELDATSGIPSFFYPVVLPPVFDCTVTGPERCAEGEYQDVQGGAAIYRDNIASCFPGTISQQDSLLVEPGNMPGPTVQGARQFCPRISGNACLNADGSQGVPMIATFWDSEVDPLGRTQVEVARLGSFLLWEVYSEGQHGVVVGRFVEEAVPGEVGRGATTLRTPILTR
ncbi:MAG: hypothetical protein JSU87_01880 [Gemmatimonadota bacterium]|nr:MAG: hypothetical protein JSU87_01880 [Gemmatimonadota bacterium]